MSVFAPLDVRGPDQRRKQLIQKLMGQTGSRVAVPMPGGAGRSGALAAAGRPFRSVGDFRGAPRPNVTQRSNILPSILARLGAMGQTRADEVSAGPGMAIAPPVSRGMNLPSPSGGTPIPAGGIQQSGAPSAGPPGGGPLGGGGVTPPAPPLPGYGSDAELAPHPDGSVGSLPSLVSNGPSPGGGLVPLGNGMYYDPSTDTVINAPPSSHAGGAVRRI